MSRKIFEYKYDYELNYEFIQYQIFVNIFLNWSPAYDRSDISVKICINLHTATP